MSRTVTLAGFAVLAAAILAWELVGRLVRRTPTLTEAVLALTRWPLGRWLVRAAWLWAGWHVFVRADRP